MTGIRALLRLGLLFTCGSFSMARAQSLPAPLREYVFAGNLTDNLGGPALQSLGGTVGAGSYVFGPNQGLVLTDSALDAAHYTIELQFSFAGLGGYQRILDFKNRRTDGGLYAYGNYLNFYGSASSPSFSDFAAGRALNLVVTRDSASGLLSIYVNGALHLSFTDGGGAAVFSEPGQPLHFFVDDLAVANEAGAGTVNWIRIFNSPLSAPDVATLYGVGAPAVVPEPSARALGLLGAGLLLAWRRRRAR